MKLVKVFKENKQFTLFSILALVVVGVAVFAPQIAVMYLGNIVEVIPGEDVTEHAVHPYTQALLGAQFSIHMDPTRRSRVSRVKHQVLWMYLRAVLSRTAASIVLTDVRQRCRS